MWLHIAKIRQSRLKYLLSRSVQDNAIFHLECGKSNDKAVKEISENPK